MERGGFTYVITNRYNTVLYTGSTSDLINRMFEHTTKVYPKSFSARTYCHKLVYFKHFSAVEEAIAHEYEIKKWNRMKKEKLITSKNRNWEDLQKHL